MATIRQIAREAGVSVGTVSNVINNPDRVSPETCERVLEVIWRHSFRPNSLARSLSTGRSSTIGLVISMNSSPFFTELAQGAIEAAREVGCSVSVVVVTDDRLDLLDQIDLLSQRRTEGIFLAIQPPPADVLRQLVTRETPMVLMDYGLEPHGNTIGQVDFDWSNGAYAATQHLIDLGHRHIGYITGIPGRSSTVVREQGFRRAMREAGIPIQPGLLAGGIFSVESGYESARALLQRSSRPTAIFAANDLMALGVLQAASELGLRVPSDLSIVGMDDVFFSVYLAPPLTTVRMHMREAGRAGIQMIHDAANNKEHSRQVVIESTLMVRGTTAAVPQGTGAQGTGDTGQRTEEGQQDVEPRRSRRKKVQSNPSISVAEPGSRVEKETKKA